MPPRNRGGFLVEWGKMKKIIFLILIIIFGIAFFQKDKLPDKENVLEQLYQEPIQTETDKSSFKIEKEGLIYNITPLYNYELYGLIVSYHHSKSWLDYYHEKWNDFINVKDICVIWGDNIKTEIYKAMEFKSGSWTCYSEFKPGTSYEVWSKIRRDNLSNNHLLTSEESLNKTIMDAKKGDQIYLKGYLVEYSHSNGSFRRGTSITRNDRGNGACETIYVTDFQILKEANLVWRLIYSFAKYLIIIYVILSFIFFFFWPIRKTKH